MQKRLKGANGDGRRFGFGAPPGEAGGGPRLCPGSIPAASGWPPSRGLVLLDKEGHTDIPRPSLGCPASGPKGFTGDFFLIPKLLSHAVSSWD